MEATQVELRPHPAPGVVAALEPDAFADLVRTGLPRRSEVTVDFGRQELRRMTGALDQELMPPFRLPRGARVKLLCFRDSHLAVQADVEDHADGTQRLPDEPAQFERRIV